MANEEVDTLKVLLKVAGYHDNSALFMLLFTANHVSLADANLAFEQGQKMREMGVVCHCQACSTRKEDAN